MKRKSKRYGKKRKYFEGKRREKDTSKKTEEKEKTMDKVDDVLDGEKKEEKKEKNEEQQRAEDDANAKKIKDATTGHNENREHDSDLDGYNARQKFANEAYGKIEKTAKSIENKDLKTGQILIQYKADVISL